MQLLFLLLLLPRCLLCLLAPLLHMLSLPPGGSGARSSDKR